MNWHNNCYLLALVQRLRTKAVFMSCIGIPVFLTVFYIYLADGVWLMSSHNNLHTKSHKMLTWSHLPIMHEQTKILALHSLWFNTGIALRWISLVMCPILEHSTSDIGLEILSKDQTLLDTDIVSWSLWKMDVTDWMNECVYWNTLNHQSDKDQRNGWSLFWRTLHKVTV